MADRRMRWSAAVAAVTALAAGCAGIPTHGAVTVGREIQAAGGIDDTNSVRVLPPPWTRGLKPTEVVSGFLHSLVDDDGNYEIARTYLTSHAADSWDTQSAVTTYDNSSPTFTAPSGTGDRRTVAFAAPRAGTIDRRGDFTPVGGTVHATFGLVRTNGQWRINGVPSGVLLSTLDAQRSYRVANVYYLSRSGSSLVPEQLVLRPGSTGVTTALVQALLSGPGPWLAPAVQSAFPAGTDLIGNVPIDNAGVAQVNLTSAVHQATAGQLRALSAQLVWTLRQVTEVTGVRLTAGGVPLSVPGVDATQPLNAWQSFDPAAPPLLDAGLYDTGGRWRGARGAIAGLDSASGLAGLALARNGADFAGLRIGAHVATLMTGRLGQQPHSRLHATTLTRPTFDAAGDAITVATRGVRRWVAMANAHGGVGTVAADAALLEHPVQQLRLSRDGARVAAIVGAAEHGRLLIGRVTQRSHGALQFEAFRAVLPGIDNVKGLSWAADDEVVVTAATPGGGREVVAVDVDGYLPRTISTAGLGPSPTDVASCPRQPLLVTAAGSVWVDDPTAGWRRLGAGDQPTYAD